jgi:hypothetical protein
MERVWYAYGNHDHTVAAAAAGEAASRSSSAAGRRRNSSRGGGDQKVSKSTKLMKVHDEAERDALADGSARLETRSDAEE